MRVSARSDYALRAVAELAASDGRPMNREKIAEAQEIPAEFLENILLELKHVGIVMSQRGAGGGFRLARKAAEISLADVIRAVDGPLANVRGNRPEVVEYRGSAAHLRDVWIAVRASLREILEEISVQDLVDGNLPARVSTLTKNPRAWVSLAFGPDTGSARIRSPRIRSPRTRNPRASAKSGGARSA